MVGHLDTGHHDLFKEVRKCHAYRTKVGRLILVMHSSKGWQSGHGKAAIGVEAEEKACILEGPGNRGWRRLLDAVVEYIVCDTVLQSMQERRIFLRSLASDLILRRGPHESCV